MRCFFKENIYAWARHQIQGLIDMGKEVEVLLCHFVQGPIVHTEPLLLAVLLRDQDHSWQPRAVGRFDYACLQHGTLIGCASPVSIWCSTRCVRPTSLRANMSLYSHKTCHSFNFWWSYRPSQFLSHMPRQKTLPTRTGTWHL